MKQSAIAAGLLWVAPWAMAGDSARAPVRVYDCPSSEYVTDAAFSPDEHYLAQAIVVQESATEVAEPHILESIRILDFRKQCAVSAGSARADAPARPPAGVPRVYGLHFTGDGRLMVFADGPSLRVLSANPMKELWNLGIPMTDHLGWFTDVAVAHDVHVAAVLAQPIRPRRPPDDTPRLMQRPEFLHLFRAYDLDTGAVRSELRLPPHLSAVGLALSPDGTRAAITMSPEDAPDLGKVPDLLIVDVTKGAIVNQFRVHSFGPVAFADNQTIYTLGPNGNGYHRRFKLVDINSGQVVREIPEPKDRTMGSLTVSADGRYIGSSLWRDDGSTLQMVREGGDFPPDEFFLWNGVSGELVARLKMDHAGALKLSPSGRFLLSGSRIFEFELTPSHIAGSH